ncbi:AAA family ATPase [Chryseolinea lacunae]|uniref:AAA family ATPase n=1 Tax=Chryseolinea lacunae TaxID=2801331 RepID=A0ABS1L1E9_9BACT|nr:ATP-binding protein [Chryseolinea lacunae]MBL0745358.1 AAA family ATPase [Chryseolinea lacunae]
MKIKTIKINNLKRFTDLTVTNIPESAKLIILVGPNGSGKTSLLEALHHWYRLATFNQIGSQDYYEKKEKKAGTADNWYENKVNVEFYGSQVTNTSKGKFYFRTAYRNEPDFTVTNLNKQSDPTMKVKSENLAQNDQTVSENYQRLIAQTIAGVYTTASDTKTVAQLRDELIGQIKTSLSYVFDDLNLSSIGEPLTNGSFYFEKGASKDFHYKNLSAGEKSVFDLILDLIIKSVYYPDAIFCIDEPEAHMHTRLQSSVLRELYKLIPTKSQLWISTHSIGMLREAEEIEKQTPGTVVFLDFDNRDFDLTEVITPAPTTKAVWDKFFDLAIADFSKLIAPQRLVFCEGTSQGRRYKDFDAQIYGIIFEKRYHDTKFISIGSSTELENIENQSMKVLSNILKASTIIKFIDLDERSSSEVQELLRKGIKTSKRRHIESYLFDDEIITKLCHSVNKEKLIPDCLKSKKNAIDASVTRKNSIDDIKSASGEIYVGLKTILGLSQAGNNKCAFVRDTLAPLITPETTIYKELEIEIFGASQTPGTVPIN